MAPRRSKARPVAVTNAALRVGVKVVPWIPPWLKRLLAGGKRVTVDGNTLDPTLQLMLAAQQRTGTGGLSAAGDPEVARALMRGSHGVMATHIEVPITDFTIPGPETVLRARHYRPAIEGTVPIRSSTCPRKPSHESCSPRGSSCLKATGTGSPICIWGALMLPQTMREYRR